MVAQSQFSLVWDYKMFLWLRIEMSEYFPFGKYRVSPDLRTSGCEEDGALHQSLMLCVLIP